MGVPATCYQALTDPATLVKTMPGLKSMTEREDGKYQAELEIGMGAIRGQYAGVMTIEDAVPNQSYRLMMEGQGQGGFNVNMQVRFDENTAGCDVRYEGDAAVGGTVAGVGLAWHPLSSTSFSTTWHARSRMPAYHNSTTRGSD